MRSITRTESDDDDIIHLDVGRVVAVGYADHATQILCADGPGFFVKDPPGQVMKALGSTTPENRGPCAVAGAFLPT